MVRSTGDPAGPSRIEYPLGRELYATLGSIRFLRFSPDGRHLAFLEDRGGRGVSGRVMVMGLDGQPAPLTDDWTSLRGLAWSPDGDEIWFTAGPARRNRALRAVTLDGEQRTLLEVPGSLTLWDVVPDGRVLLTRDEERRAVIGQPPARTAERDYSLYDDAGLADISEDGRWLQDEPITLWPVAGGDPRPVLGSEPGERPVAWSADGRSLWLFKRGEVPAHVLQLDIETGGRPEWKTLVPPDAAGVFSIIDFQITPAGDAYFYSYTQLLSQLYLVRGLR